MQNITVIGGGLAGSEAASTLLRAGYKVTMIEQKPVNHSGAHKMDTLAELVCSNSLRSDRTMNAVGLIKWEMEQLGGLLIKAARATAVPAGRALAVDRFAFSELVTKSLLEHPDFTIEHRELTAIPAGPDPVIIATGPLTSQPLLQAIIECTGEERLSFYDALAPIVDGSSIDMSKCFLSSRYDEDADYLNFPLSKEQFDAFYEALTTAEVVPLAHGDAQFFEGCLPVEEIARRGRHALRFGPLKPVGLTDLRDGVKPYGVLQLRREDVDGQSWNIVGFQTRLKQPEQKRVLSFIPGLEKAKILRYGAIHQNAFVVAPKVLDGNMCLINAPWVQIAGQLSGVEGYVESMAHGMLTALLLIIKMRGLNVPPPPPTCALGAMYRHVTGQVHLSKKIYEPHNVHWGLFPPVTEGNKAQRGEIRYQRGVKDFTSWKEQLEKELQLAPSRI